MREEIIDFDRQDTAGSGARVASFGPYRLYPGERRLERDGLRLEGSGRALDLLVALVERAGTTVTKRELFALVWPHARVEESSLRVNIAGLRKLLRDGEGGARYIVNVPGRGYSFVAPVSIETIALRAGPATARPETVPTMAQTIVGREQERKALAISLAEEGFVTVVGPGGVGKSMLAAAAVKDWTERTGGAVCWIDVSLLEPGRIVLQEIASRLDGARRPAFAGQELSHALMERPVLVVIDNAEHAIECAAQAAQWLAACAPAATILATGREALRARGEHVFLLPPLACPPAGDRSADLVTRYPAASLLVERIRSLGVCTAEPTVRCMEVITRICRAMDGLPLAIELAANGVGVFGPWHAADLVETAHMLDWPGRRTDPARHRSLRAVLDASYRRLGDAERRVFRRLAIFTDSFTMAEALAVTGETHADGHHDCRVVGQLVERSLLDRVFVEGRHAGYRYLWMTRAYALEKLLEGSSADIVESSPGSA